MNKEKRNIATKLETESKYLTNILDKEDVKDFKKLIPELQDTWMKKQICLLYTSPSPRDGLLSRMPSSA